MKHIAKGTRTGLKIIKQSVFVHVGLENVAMGYQNLL